MPPITCETFTMSDFFSACFCEAFYFPYHFLLPHMPSGMCVAAAMFVVAVVSHRMET